MQVITLIFHPMSIKKIVSVVFLTAALLTARGQATEFRAEAGIGTYSMSDLKTLLAQSVKYSSLGIKTTEDFPSYVFYGVDIIQYVSPKVGVGIASGFYSTGGRNHLADYSGSFREDIKVNSVNLGLLTCYKEPLGNHFFGQLEVSSGIKFSNILIEDELRLYETTQDTSYDCRSEGWWIKPQIRIGRTFKSISIAAFAGYEYNLKSKIKLRQNPDYTLNPKIDWSGLRAGISISYIKKDD